MARMVDQTTTGSGRGPLDAFGSAYVRDPYPTFRRLRAEDPVWFAEDLGVWVVSRYDDAREVLADAQAFSNALTLAPLLPICEHAGRVLGGLDVDPVTAAGDPPQHTRTRRALMATFPSTPRKAAVCEPMVRARVDELIERMRARGEADLVRDFTWELPVLVILTLIGAPDEDFDRIKQWSDGQIALIWGTPSEAEQVVLAESLIEFWQYCRQLVADRVDDRRGDLVSALLEYRGGSDEVLTEREIASIAFNLLVAGHETTSNLVSNGMLHLLATGAWEELAADRERIPDAVEEMLRYDPPIVGWLRATKQPVTLAGVDIPAGQRILVLLGSANHDEDRFTDPDRFDAGRSNASDHLAFGVGRHFCVGAALSRLEARVALEALADRLPGLRLREDFEPQYVPNVAFRALQTMPVVWDDSN